MKYILMVQKTTGYFIPVVFAEELVHRDVARGCGQGMHIVSAGFCRKSRGPGGGWKAYGNSNSLRLGSRPVTDGLLLTLFLQEGLAGLQLNNYLTMLEFQATTKEPLQCYATHPVLKKRRERPLGHDTNHTVGQHHWSGIEANEKN